MIVIHDNLQEYKHSAQSSSPVRRSLWPLLESCPF